MNRRGLAGLIVFVAETAAPTALAWPQDVEPFTPVDQAVEDVDPLARSERRMTTGIEERHTAFEQVYHVPGRADLFMRVNGAVYAVFPRSVYVGRRGDQVPVIPHDTVFYLGREALDRLAGQPPPVESAGAPAAAGTQPPAGGQIDPRLEPERLEAVRIDTRVRTTADGTESDPDRLRRRAISDRNLGVGVSIVTDDGYRARRVRSLLRRAAQVDRDGGGDGAPAPAGQPDDGPGDQAARGRSSSPSK